jgi:hypothetical protein
VNTETVYSGRCEVGVVIPSIRQMSAPFKTAVECLQSTLSGRIDSLGCYRQWTFIIGLPNAPPTTFLIPPKLFPSELTEPGIGLATRLDW